MTQPLPEALTADKPTPRLLIERAMLDSGWTLERLVTARRPDTSWRLIAIEVTHLTGIDITGEALRGWFA